MFNGYPLCPALTSLALLASLAAVQAAPPNPHACSDIRRLYSTRMLRELRARLMLAYAESHERRAAEIAAAIRSHTPVVNAVQEEPLTIRPRESDDQQLRHLLAYVTKNCL